MALLFPWATKEYLLWQMSIGQIVMYHNIGVEIKYPQPGPNGNGKHKPSISNYAQAKAARDQMKAQGLINEQAQSDDAKAQYRTKYGDV